jgi:hypothetical protein
MDSCEASHTGFMISGRIKVVADNGTKVEYGRPADYGIFIRGKTLG